MDFRELLTAFRHQKLTVDCVEMTLLQDDTKKPAKFRGKGFIRQTIGGGIEFKLYVSDFANTSMLHSLRTQLKQKSGRIYASDNYYTLTALASDGTTWTSYRILPRCNWVASNNVIVIGDLDSISYTQHKNVRQHLIEVYFFDDITIAGLRRQQTAQTKFGFTEKFEAAGADFIVSKDELGLKVDAKSRRLMPAEMHTRILEALKFVLARPIAYRVLVRQDANRRTVEFSKGVPSSIKVRLDPPLATTDHDHQSAFTELFGKYLAYVVSSTPHPYWNFCTYHLHNACESSANSIDSWALGLSVAVEGIAALIEPPDAPDAKELKALGEWLLKKARPVKKFAAFIPRLNGLLGMLSHVRPQDKMALLAKSGHLSKADAKAWVELRNRHAHPKPLDLTDVGGDHYQRLIDLINKTTVLMYHLTFYLIGYRGKYTDYGTHGYPISDYPLNKTSSATNSSTIDSKHLRD